MIASRHIRTSIIVLICSLVAVMIVNRYAMAHNHEEIATAEHDRAIKALELTADEIVKFVSEVKLEEALLRLQLLHKQLAEVKLLQYTSIEGAHGLFNAIVELKQRLVAIQPDLELCTKAAVIVRLGIDALHSDGERLWHQYYKPLSATLAQLEKQIKAGEGSKAIQTYEKLQYQYSIVAPSILIKHDPSQANLVQSLLKGLGNTLQASASNQTAINSEQGIQLIQHLNRELAVIFGQKDRTAFLAMPGPAERIYWSAIIGSLIVTMLAYVAWLKFRFNKGYVAVSRKDKKDPFIDDYS